MTPGECEPEIYNRRRISAAKCAQKTETPFAKDFKSLLQQNRPIADIHVSVRPCDVQQLPTAKNVKEVTPEKPKQPTFVPARLYRKRFGVYPRG